MSDVTPPDDEQWWVDAIYETSRIPRFSGNPLIEALPESPDDETIEGMFESLPKFSDDQRSWSSLDRMHQIDGLASFMKPMKQQVKLFRALERMVRNGYVGRAPRTAAHSAISAKLYKLQKEGKSFFEGEVQITPQISTAVIGVSGMGKTTTLKRWSKRMDYVILHPVSKAYQVMALHIELVDGSSIKSLALAILQALERKIPRSNYVKLNTQDRPNDSVLILRAAKLMHHHCVGMLICDEVQNLTHTPKGAAVLMTQLVSMCNVLEVPLLFVGTNKATKVLNIEARLLRRSVGEGVSVWDRLVPLEFGGNGEWEEFLKTLWDYQWVRKPVKYSPEFSTIIYWATQGIVDLTIKLFRSAQIRAIEDRTEALSIELFKSVHDIEFKIIHHMLEALRADDYEALMNYDDIRPLQFDKHLEKMQAKLRAMKTPLHSVTPSDETFKVRLLTSLTSCGYSYEEAEEAVDHVIASGKARDLKTGRRQAEDYLDTPTRPPKKNARRTGAGTPPKSVEDPKRFDSDAKDYRRAYAHAERDGTTVREMLDRLGMAPLVDEFLDLGEMRFFHH
jgi:hypothetical protein